MKVSALSDILGEQDPEARVCVMSREMWPFECLLAGVTTRDELLDADGDEVEEADHAPTRGPRLSRDDVSGVQRALCRQGSRAAWGGGRPLSFGSGSGNGRFFSE